MSTATDREAELLTVARDVVKLGMARGATQIEAFAEHSEQTSCSLEQNEIKGAAAAAHRAIGIRVFVGDSAGKRSGFAYVNRLEESALSEALDDALAIARASVPDKDAGLTENPGPVAPVSGLYDESVAALSPDDVVRLALALRDAARATDARASIDSGQVAATVAHNAIVTSTGIERSGSETAATWGLFGMAIDGSEVGSFDHAYEGARAAHAIDAQKTGALFAQRVVALLRPKASKAYRGRVLFSADAFEEIFLEALFEAVDGDSVTKGKSRLKDKLGARIAAAGFTVIDDGAIPGGLGSSHFDREGLGHRRVPIVGDGVLHRFLTDVKSARRAGTLSTGHAQGSARQLPSIGSTNVRVVGGTHSDDALLAELKNGLYVGRFSGDVDGVSGDFSGVAKGSFQVVRGEKRHVVKETLIAGNVFEALSHIVARGALEHRNMATLCPHVLVDGIDVTAGDDA